MRRWWLERYSLEEIRVVAIGLASQAEGRGFEPHRPLLVSCGTAASSAPPRSPLAPRSEPQALSELTHARLGAATGLRNDARFAVVDAFVVGGAGLA